MPITYSDRARQVGEYIADQDIELAERVAIAKDLMEGVKKELEDGIDPVRCVAEGQLSVAIAGADLVLGLLG